MSNLPRLATRNRRHWKAGEPLIERIAEDGALTPEELEELREWRAGGQAFGSVLDINDASGRATSLVQVRILQREREAWIERLPELRTA